MNFSIVSAVTAADDTIDGPRDTDPELDRALHGDRNGSWDDELTGGAR